MKHYPVVLIIRFSSIGDVVLTTPVVRCIKQQFPDSKIHFAVKSSFASVIEDNPFIEQIHRLGDDWDEFIKSFEGLEFDWVVDLHKNPRSWRLKRHFKGCQHFSFDKKNFEKWLLVNFKINRLPTEHLVDRYFKGLSDSGITNDHLGCDFFIPEGVRNNLAQWALPRNFVSIVAGGRYYTKQIPAEILAEAIIELQRPVVLLGGKEDRAHSEDIIGKVGGDSGQIWNLTGETDLKTSAAVVNESQCLITPDTGLMHIGAALKKPIVSVWGNTVTDFGMYPYYGSEEKASELSRFVQNPELSCRPCTKLGYEKCPKGHFKCMIDISSSKIADKVLELINEN